MQGSLVLVLINHDFQGVAGFHSLPHDLSVSGQKTVFSDWRDAVSKKKKCEILEPNLCYLPKLVEYNFVNFVKF